MLLDSDDEDYAGRPPGTGILALADDDDDDGLEDDAEGRDEEPSEDRLRNEFRNQLDSTGVRSAVRGVVALTATPAACGHDLSHGASQVIHQICEMKHPSNYVGCERVDSRRTIARDPRK